MAEAMTVGVEGQSFDEALFGDSKRTRLVKRDVANPRLSDLKRVVENVLWIHQQPDIDAATDRVTRSVNAFDEPTGNVRARFEAFRAHVENSDAIRAYAAKNPGDVAA